MNTLRTLLATLGVGLACSAAQAGGVSWSIGISLPPVATVISNGPGYGYAPYYAPAPVHAPPPVVYRPAPIYYAPPPVVYRPAPIYYAPPPAVVYAPVPPRGRHWHHPHRYWDRADHRDHRHGRGHWRDRD